MRLNFNATIDTMRNITLPPLPVPLPKLPPLPKKLPPLPVVKKAATRPTSCQAGDGFVQVLLAEPDDAAMRLLMMAEGVEFIAGSIVPKTGILFSTVAPGGKIRYCWRI